MVEAKKMVTSPSLRPPSFVWVVSATPPLAFLIFAVVVGVVTGMPLPQLTVLVVAALALLAVLIIVPLLQKKRYRALLAERKLIGEQAGDETSAA